MQLACPIPTKGFSFALYGKASAFSEKHFDPEGACTIGLLANRIEPQLSADNPQLIY
jgi:hypothetical protein